MSQMLDVVGYVAPGTAYVAASGNAFTADIAALGGPKVITVTVAESAGSIIYVRVGGQNIALNNNAALTAGTLNDFSFILNGTDTFNIRFNQNTTIRYLTISQGLN